MNKHFDTFEGMHYLVAYPDDYDKSKAYPVIFLIHGAGTRGNDPKALDDSVFFSSVAEVERFPFIVVSPLCYADTWFDIYEKLKRFIVKISSEPFADKKRIYAMGASMGGYTVWQLGMSMPELFAAIAPICGGGMYWNAGRLVNVPVWAFHGQKDGCVLVEESIKMVNKVNEYGGNAKLTVYPDVAHNVWLNAYKNQELYDWFLSHENRNDKAVENLYNDASLFG